MRNDLTVIYYTANTEQEKFETKIRKQLLKSINGLPLISVSRKPIQNFGTNICVGLQPYCDRSAFHQLLIGLERAKTTFAIATEADCLYPPEYFTFTPPKLDHAYRYDNVWLFHSWLGCRSKGLFWNKTFSEGAQMVGRKYWIQ